MRGRGRSGRASVSVGDGDARKTSCLHEDTEVGEDVFKNPVYLVDLKRDHSEAQLGKQVEVLAVDEAWAENPRFTD